MQRRIESFLIFLSLLLLPSQIGRHFWPEFAYVFSLKIDYLTPTLYVWDLIVIGLFISWLFRKPRINSKAQLVFLIFLSTQLISFMFTKNVGIGLVRLEQYLIAGLFGFYIANQNFLKFSKVMYLPIGISLLLESLLGLGQFILGKTLGFWILGERSFSINTPGIAKFDFYGKEFLRPYATFPHPNVFSAYLLVMTPLLQLGQVKGKSKWLGILQPFISFLLVLMAVSRSAIIAGMALLFFVLSKRWLIVLGFWLLILSPILFTRYSALINFDSLTLTRREELSVIGLRVFLNNIVLGVGLNNFIPYAVNDLVSGPSRFLQPIHNVYLLALAETGVVGFLGWILLIGYALRRLFKQEKGEFKYLLLFIWLIFMFLGVFDHFLLTLPQGYRLLFFIWGLSLCYAFNGKKALRRK